MGSALSRDGPGWLRLARLPLAHWAPEMWATEPLAHEGGVVRSSVLAAGFGGRGACCPCLGGALASMELGGAVVPELVSSAWCGALVSDHQACHLLIRWSGGG
jgi:hypothetical protein